MDYLDASTIQMVRDLNVVIAGATDDEIRPVIQNHALPRVRFRMLTATDTLGRNVFYGRVTDLATPEVQKAAEMLLEQVMGHQVVSDGLRRIVAALACSWMTTQIAAQIEEQAKFAEKLEKQALSDLDHFIRSPVLGGVVSSVKATVVERYQAESFGLALDVDPDTLDRTRLTARSFESAQGAGELRLYIDGVKIAVPVQFGDTPAALMRKLSLATVQQSALRKINLISMDQTSGPQTYAKTISIDDQTFAVRASSAVTEGRFQQRSGANILAAVASLSLIQRINNQLVPGVAGLTLGYGADYPSFSSTLNPVILADIKNCDFVLPIDPEVCFSPSDLLCFRSSGSFSPNRSDGSPNVFSYQVSAISKGTSSIPIRGGSSSIRMQDGWTALELVEAIAQDLAAKRAQFNILGAVLPVITVDVNGTRPNVPALDLVGFNLEQEVDVRLMFQVTAMPEGLETALATRAYNAHPFSEEPDAVVVYAITLGRTEIVQLDSQGQGGVSAVEAKPSSQMDETLKRIRNMLDTGR